MGAALVGSSLVRSVEPENPNELVVVVEIELDAFNGVVRPSMFSTVSLVSLVVSLMSLVTSVISAIGDVGLVSSGESTGVSADGSSSPTSLFRLQLLPKVCACRSLSSFAYCGLFMNS